MIKAVRHILYKYGLVISAVPLCLLVAGHFVGWNDHNGFLSAMLVLAVAPLFGQRG